ncbi:CHC2 zinc finger domain-containing protein [Desulfovibrio sp. OttesenSCG-928-G11]|nr:CHC2 zinc finger domain-containing protein [Desulfovibrio sp. OttesenSCG-928-G11]
MNLDVDFVSVMSTLGLSMKQKSGNYQCPFCTKKSFTVYPDQKAYCHTCNWSGDALQLYCEWEKVSRSEAIQKLGLALKNGYIQLKEQTYAEAKSELAKDLEFLTWVRMYEGFNPDYTRKVVIEKSGVTKGTLSKIIKGEMVNGLTWRKVLAVLRIDLEPRIKIMKKNLALGPKYFENLLDEEKRGKDVEKFRIKKKRLQKART